MMVVRVFKDKVGSALMMVLIVFMFITILIASVFFVAGSNTRQVASQNQGIQSYYIARSGAEATYQVLVTSSSSLLTQFSTGNTVQNSSINFEEGETEVSVVGFNEGTTRRIRITSIGKMEGSHITRKAVLEFNYGDYGDIKWSR